MDCGVHVKQRIALSCRQKNSVPLQIHLNQNIAPTDYQSACSVHISTKALQVAHRPTVCHCSIHLNQNIAPTNNQSACRILVNLTVIF